MPAVAPPAGIYWNDPDEIADIVHYELVNSVLLGLGHARDLLAAGQLGPQALKATMASISSAITLLQTAGIPFTNGDQQQAPRMIIKEMTAAEVEATQTAAEAEYRGGMLATDWDDDADEEA